MTNTSHPKLAVIGAGSWGTALAMVAARNGIDTLLWGPEVEVMQQCERDRVNAQYLGDIPFPEPLTICHDFDTAVKQCTHVLLVVPSHAFLSVLEKIKPLINEQAIIWATKGMDPETDLFPSQMLSRVFADSHSVGLLSGPSFAKEVALEVPTAVVSVANNHQLAVDMERIFHSPNFQLDQREDFIGVQVCGTAKNIIAIATGLADGLKCGANTRAAIITRGLAEIQQLGLALGAKADSFTSLAGLGDLVLTCSDDQSRNRRFGLALGAGKNPSEAKAKIGQVVEGEQNTFQVMRLANKLGIRMPITNLIHDILSEEIPISEARQHLLS